MKANGLFILLAAFLFCTAIDADAIVVGGAPSCGSWVESHKSSKASVAKVSDEAWVAGFLSGLAMGVRKDFLVETDPPSLFLWITNYCRANPLDSTADAGQRLAVELIKRKGL